MLKDGKHGPTLFVQTTAPKMVITGLADLPGKPEARLFYLLALGRKLGADSPGEHVRDLYHWPATVEGGVSPMLVLFVLGFAHPHASNQEILRLLRDKLGPA